MFNPLRGYMLQTIEKENKLMTQIEKETLLI